MVSFFKAHAKKYADGHIAGGQLVMITFAPEHAYFLEARMTTEVFDRPLRSNLALFTVKYKNVQNITAGVLAGIPSCAAFSSAVVPVGDARAKGFEWENTLVPTNLGYTDFKYGESRLFPNLVFASGAPGYFQPARPKWTGSMSAQYETRKSCKAVT